LGPAYPIETKPGRWRYTVTFCDVILHAWTKESFAQPEAGQRTGRNLAEFTNSRFLNYAHQSTFARRVITAEIRHFALITLDAMIDVACTAPPEVTATVLTSQDLGLSSTP